MPGLPEELIAQICPRAEGIPLYAVETIRMLQDRGLLGAGGRPVRADRRRLASSTCPRRCTRSAASRLDGLGAVERAAPAGRVRARPVVHRGRRRGAQRPLGAEVSDVARRARRQAGARPRRRSALARARSVRRSSRRCCGPWPTAPCRGGPQGRATSPRRATWRAPGRARPARHRRGAGLALPRGIADRARRRRRGRAPDSARETA